MRKASLLFAVLGLLQQLQAEAEPAHGSIAPVELSLQWFALHQDPDGCWDPGTYRIHCPDSPKCEPDTMLREDPLHLVQTATALICFLAGGYDQTTPNRFRSTCRKALGYLLSCQKTDGSFSSLNYQNAMAIEALADDYWMSGDATLSGPVQRAVDALLAQQNRNRGLPFGWDEAGSTARNDTWVTGWCIMALVSAKRVEIDVHDGLSGARRWLEAAWSAANPRRSTFDPRTDEADFPAVYRSDSAMAESCLPIPGHPESDSAAIGGMCAVYLGRHAGDLMLETLANHVMKRQMPSGAPSDPYNLLMGHVIIFSCGGDRLNEWDLKMKGLKQLCAAQSTGKGCKQGSYDPGQASFRDVPMGRVLATAFYTRCQEFFFGSSGELVGN